MDLNLPSAQLMVGLVEMLVLVLMVWALTSSLVQVRMHVLVHVRSRCVRGYRAPGAALVPYSPRVRVELLVLVRPPGAALVPAVWSRCEWLYFGHFPCGRPVRGRAMVWLLTSGISRRISRVASLGQSAGYSVA